MYVAFIDTYFPQDVEAIAQYALSIAYSPSLEELGFDPTVKRVYVDGKAQYEYTINGRVYQTIEVLSNFRAAALVSRATRVWKATCAEDHGADVGTVYAVKDVWIGMDAKTERQIQDDIFAQINKVNQVKGLSGEQEDYKKYFMKIKDCEIVQVKSGASSGEEYSSKIFMHGHSFPDTRSHPDLRLQHDMARGSTVRSRTKTSHSYTPQGATRLSETSQIESPMASHAQEMLNDALTRSKYEIKKQVRVVFEDVGVPLAKLMVHDQSQFFKALGDAAIGDLFVSPH